MREPRPFAPQTWLRIFWTFAVIAVALVVLSGCGVRSPLDPDEDSPAPRWTGYVVKRAR